MTQQKSMFSVANLADTIKTRPEAGKSMSLEASEEEIVEQLLEYHPKATGTFSSVEGSPQTRKTVGFTFPDDLKSNEAAE